MKKILQIIILISIFQSQSAFSQELTAQAKFDRNMILIGDQINFSLELSQPRNMEIAFPQFPDTLVDKVEILEKTTIDTTFITADQVQINQNYTVTCFDSGGYVIPPIPFAFEISGRKDTLWTQPAWLGVTTFQIDSIQGINDIKPVKETPFTFEEFTERYLTTIIIIILAMAVVIFIVIYLRKRKKNQPVFSRPKPKIPAHITALDALDDLKGKKLWQQGLAKEYQSELTEIIRRYIENRFSISAMEETSYEIIGDMKSKSGIDKVLINKLQTMFEISDLTKFAKAKPTSDEHEQGLKLAYDFVVQTKQKTELNSSNSIENINESKIQQNKKENDISKPELS